MSEKQTTQVNGPGLMINLPNERIVSLYALEDGHYLFIFTNQSVITKVKLTQEAVQAMWNLFVEFRAGGFAA